MKNLQASFSEDANKIVDQAEQEKAPKENLNFLIDLSPIMMVAADKVTTEEESKTFNTAWNHLDVESQKSGERQFEIVCQNDQTIGIAEHIKIRLPLFCRFVKCKWVCGI